MVFLESLRIELAGTGVSVTIVPPDFVQSEIHQRSLESNDKPLGHLLQDHKKYLSAEACAGIIVKAMARRKRFVVTSMRSKLGRWVKLCFPQVIDRMAQKRWRKPIDSKEEACCVVGLGHDIRDSLKLVAFFSQQGEKPIFTR